MLVRRCVPWPRARWRLPGALGPMVSHALRSVPASTPVTRFSRRLATSAGRPGAGAPISPTASWHGPAVERAACTSPKTAAGLRTATPLRPLGGRPPSGLPPLARKRHRAMRHWRATATRPLRHPRWPPPPTRSRHQPRRARSGCSRPPRQATAGALQRPWRFPACVIPGARARAPLGDGVGVTPAQPPTWRRVCTSRPPQHARPNHHAPWSPRPWRGLTCRPCAPRLTPPSVPSPTWTAPTPAAHVAAGHAPWASHPPAAGRRVARAPCGRSSAGAPGSGVSL
jgi:hypothetical protein